MRHLTILSVTQTLLNTTWQQ